MSKEYQGHKSYNHWNVVLYIANDEGLCNLAKEAIRKSKTLDAATDYMMELLDGQKTPDGVPYRKTTVRAALEHWDD